MTPKIRKRLIISLSAVVLAGGAVTGGFLLGHRNGQEDATLQSSAPSSPRPPHSESAPPPSVEATPEAEPEILDEPEAPPAQPVSPRMNLDEIRQGNFSSIAGTWATPSPGVPNAITHITITSDGIMTITGDPLGRFQLMLANTADNNFYLGTRSLESPPQGIGLAAAIALYPAGSAIPVVVEGNTVTDSRFDQTDRTRDRIYIAQGAADPQMTAERVLYRQ